VSVLLNCFENIHISELRVRHCHEDQNGDFGRLLINSKILRHSRSSEPETNIFKTPNRQQIAFFRKVYENTYTDIYLGQDV
jgi:hypothetical protein